MPIIEAKKPLAILAGIALTMSMSVSATILYSEDFNTDNGAFTVVNDNAPEGPWTYDGVGSWSTDGSENKGVPSHSRLNSPLINVTTANELTLMFDHRYSFEGDWDGGAVFLSVNGGSYTQILLGAFSQKEYTKVGIVGNHDLNGKDGFSFDSLDYFNGSFITSIASLGSFSVGDTLSVQFLAAWDEFAKGSEPNWQLDSLKITSPMPEPTILALFSLGLAGLVFSKRKRV